MEELEILDGIYKIANSFKNLEVIYFNKKYTIDLSAYTEQIMFKLYIDDGYDGYEEPWANLYHDFVSNLYDDLEI